MAQGWGHGWVELLAGRGGVGDGVLWRRGVGAGREGSGAAGVWRGVQRSPGAVGALHKGASQAVGTGL